MVEIVPSILSADFARLAEEIARVERGGATILHLDVMDGHFVPNITIGPPVVESLRKATQAHLDVHLMIENAGPLRGAVRRGRRQSVSVHYEACPHLDGTLELIRKAGAMAGVVLNPATRWRCWKKCWEWRITCCLMSVNPGFRRPETDPVRAG